MPRRGLAFLAAVGMTLPAATAGQEAAERPSCPLVFESLGETRSVSREVAPGFYVTHVGGRMRWTCAQSRMEADSAVKYDRAARLEMIGDVDYVDSVRTLTSRRLTYHERENRIVAERDVELTRRASGAVLRAPRVEFFRAGSGRVERTVATGRPHLVLPPEEGEGDSFEVDGDSAVFLGEEEARVYGDVVVQRRDLHATADSATFLIGEGKGFLFGEPEVTGEEIRLRGERIRTLLDEGELREVEAVEAARASGEEFRMFASRILARLREGEPERIHAHGEGRSVSVSEEYRLAGDSLDFAFVGGALERVIAVGSASAVEMEEIPEDPTVEVPLTVAGGRNWVSGDTIHFILERSGSESDSAAARARATPDTADAPGAAEDGRRDRSRRLDRIRAVGSARAFYLVESDTAGAEEDSRDYVIGEEIEIVFREGEVDRVIGRQAIGIHLDPAGPGGREPAPPPAGAGQDTTPPAPPAEPDTGGARPAEPDSAGVRRDGSGRVRGPTGGGHR